MASAVKAQGAHDAIAHKMIEYYGAHAAELNGWTLYVVPTANPDGMRYGVNNYREGTAGAYGRCTSQGKDINRNFSSATFPEHDALKALVDEIKPTIIVDFHGWYDCYYGNARIGDFFANAFNAKYAGKPSRYCFVASTGVMDCGSTLGGVFHGNTTIGRDLFAEWAISQRHIPAALVEYPAPDLDRDGTYDAVFDPVAGYTRIKSASLDLLSDRTRVALSDLFAQYD